MKTWFGVRLQVAAGLLSLANLSLIWWFRFLPLYDYPIWLYEVRIIRGLADTLTRNAMNRVRAFSWDLIAEKTLDVYRAAIAK